MSNSFKKKMYESKITYNFKHKLLLNFILGNTK